MAARGPTPAPTFYSPTSSRYRPWPPDEPAEPVDTPYMTLTATSPLTTLHANNEPYAVSPFSEGSPVKNDDKQSNSRRFDAFANGEAAMKGPLDGEAPEWMSSAPYSTPKQQRSALALGHMSATNKRSISPRQRPGKTMAENIESGGGSGGEEKISHTVRSRSLNEKAKKSEGNQRNSKAATVKRIPVPGVREFLDQDSNLLRSRFFRPPHKYIHTSDGETQLTLPECTRIVYDMDTDDEEWLKEKEQERLAGDITLSAPISEELFENLMDRLEKESHTLNELVMRDMALKLLDGIAPEDAIESVHGHWLQKRTKKGMPLVRQFQPPPWEQYQSQQAAWQADIQQMMQAQPGVTRQQLQQQHKRPPIFAFCLRPRSHQDKLQRQRSHKKLDRSATEQSAMPNSPGARRGSREATEAGDFHPHATTDSSKSPASRQGKGSKQSRANGSKKKNGRSRRKSQSGRPQSTILDLAGAFKAVAQRQQRSRPSAAFLEKIYNSIAAMPPDNRAVQDASGSAVLAIPEPSKLTVPLPERAARQASARKARRAVIGERRLQRNVNVSTRLEAVRPMHMQDAAKLQGSGAVVDAPMLMLTEESMAMEQTVSLAFPVKAEQVDGKRSELRSLFPGTESVSVAPGEEVASAVQDGANAMGISRGNVKPRTKKRNSWLKPKKRINKREQRVRLMAAAAASRMKRKERQLEQQRELQLLQQQLGLGAPDFVGEQDQVDDGKPAVSSLREGAHENLHVKTENGDVSTGSPPVVAVYQRRSESRRTMPLHEVGLISAELKNRLRGLMDRQISVGRTLDQRPVQTSPGSLIELDQSEGDSEISHENLPQEQLELGQPEVDEGFAAAKRMRDQANSLRANAIKLGKAAEVALERAIAAMSAAETFEHAVKLASEESNHRPSSGIERRSLRQKRKVRDKPGTAGAPKASRSISRRGPLAMKKRRMRNKLSKDGMQVDIEIALNGKLEALHSNGGITELRKDGMGSA